LSKNSRYPGPILGLCVVQVSRTFFHRALTSDVHVMVLAQIAQVSVQLFDSFLVRLDPLALQPFIELEQ